MRQKTKWVAKAPDRAEPEFDAGAVEDPDYCEPHAGGLGAGPVDDGPFPEDAFTDGGVAPRDAPRAEGPGGANAVVRALRALSGAIAMGTTVLALVVVVTAVLAARRHFPGPGVESIAVHVAGAVAVLLAQRYADRRRGIGAVAASLAVPVVTGLVLWTQWWN